MDPILFFLVQLFMGSEKYPYKGILDLFANRGFSEGNELGWTATDHTVFSTTVSTVGEQGFLQLLPIYVDHIFFPTTTNARYVVVSFFFILCIISHNAIQFCDLRGQLLKSTDSVLNAEIFTPLLSFRYITLISQVKMQALCIVNCKEKKNTSSDDLMWLRSAAATSSLLMSHSLMELSIRLQKLQAVDIEAKLQGLWIVYVH